MRLKTNCESVNTMTRRFFDSYSKSVAITSIAAILLLSGCGDDTAKATNSPSGMSEHEVVGDHAIGNLSLIHI